MYVDSALQYHNAMFAQNGGSGFLLKHKVNQFAVNFYGSVLTCFMHVSLEQGQLSTSVVGDKNRAIRVSFSVSIMHSLLSE